jgi:integrase
VTHLTDAELYKQTGYRKPALQRRKLDEQGIYYDVPRSGRPVVSWPIQYRPGYGPQAHNPPRPTAQDGAEGRELLLRLQREAANVDAPGISVGDLVQRYIDRSDDLADGTRKQYQSYHRAIAAAFPIPAAQLTSQIVALWRDLPAQRQRKTYVNGCLAVLRAAYLLGGEQGLATPLSVRGWTLKARDRYLEDAEFRAIRERAPEWLQVAMDLAYVTAARRSDVLACQWSHCSPDGVAMRQQKTGQRISFTVTPELSSILARARQRRVIGLYVVANTKGRPISRTALEYAWGIACKAAGVVAQFRDIRAKAATDAKSGGQDYQKLLGHANAAMSERYIKRRETTIAEPVRRKL